MYMYNCKEKERFTLILRCEANLFYRDEKPINEFDGKHANGYEKHVNGYHVIRNIYIAVKNSYHF